MHNLKNMWQNTCKFTTDMIKHKHFHNKSDTRRQPNRLGFLLIISTRADKLGWICEDSCTLLAFKYVKR